tara:strand:- start:3289 stop:3480 length:192 start_codon:yes stop_codon:yes gene_type:complete
MTTYLVTIPEIHERLIKIDAPTPDEAITLVAQNQGSQVSMKYTRTLEQVYWITEEVPEDREDA